MSRPDTLRLHDLVVDHVYTLPEKEGWQWQPSLTHALSGLSAAQAAWKPSPDRHSIWQSVRHLTLWKGGVVDAWNGNPADGRQLLACDRREAGGGEQEWTRDRQMLLRSRSNC